jgi:predicted  nucleic acid-binding Zn-ribbon protein
LQFYGILTDVEGIWCAQGGGIEVGFLYGWGVMSMSTYDTRLATLEKGVTVMKQDIIYKLDETNSAIAILKGVAGSQGQDIKDIKNQLKDVNFRLNGVEIGLETLTQEVETIKGRLGGIDQRLDGIDKRFVSMEEKFDKRFEQIDKRFEQVLQILATLANKP